MNINDFDLLPSVHPSVKEHDNLRVVDEICFMGWESGGFHKEIAAERFKRSGVDNPDDWEVVGSHYRDLSGWCEYEQKMEYHHETLLLLIHKDQYLNYLKLG